MKRKAFLETAALLLALVPGSLWAASPAQHGEAVYTMDNAPGGNHILAFERASDGSLIPDGRFPTGGTGTGTGLGNQGSLLLTRDGRWLVACNAGSDEITLFSVTERGLVIKDKVSSGGRRPISLTLHRNLLYVLNAGGAAGAADNITGFFFAYGRLSHCEGSTRPLSATNVGPAQISFTRDGEALVVTEKATGLIGTYTVGDDGLVDGYKTTPSPSPTPFGFAVGRENRIFVSQANGGAPNGSSVSSFSVSEDGSLQVITPSSPTHETAACWVALTPSERFAYTTNTGSGTISGYSVSRSGSLNLLQANGISASTGTGSNPIDLAFTRNGQYLHTLNSGNGTISSFRVHADGSLQPVSVQGALPAGANGLAAR